ncbi:hypothetical protein ACTFIW_008981 [Dictyostelium discoideum]
MKRSELQNHLKNINHQFYMNKLIDKLISKVNQSNKIINDLKKKLEFNYQVYKNKWTISNYSLYCMTIGKPLKVYSPEFSICSYKFQVCLYPHGENKKHHPSMYLKINNLNGNTVELEYSYRLVNVLDNSKSITINMGQKVFNESIKWGLGEIFIPSSLINKENGWVNDDDKLTIEIFIKILNQTFETLNS